LHLEEDEYYAEMLDDVLDTYCDDTKAEPPDTLSPTILRPHRPAPVLGMPPEPNREMTPTPGFYDRPHLSPSSSATDEEDEVDPSRSLRYRRSIASSITSSSTLVDDRSFIVPTQRDKHQPIIISDPHHQPSSLFTPRHPFSASPSLHPGDHRRAPHFSRGPSPLTTVDEVPTKHPYVDVSRFPAVPTHTPRLDTAAAASFTLQTGSTHVEDDPPPYSPSVVRRPLPQVPRTLPGAPSAPRVDHGVSFLDNIGEDEVSSEDGTVEAAHWPVPPRAALSM
jgi:hypothetical protein